MAARKRKDVAPDAPPPPAGEHVAPEAATASGPPPGLDAEVGVEAVKAALSGMEADAGKGKRKRGRPSKNVRAERDFAGDLAKMSESLVAYPFQIISTGLAVAGEPELSKLWELDKATADLAGSAVRVLALRHADDLAEKLPWIVLIGTLGGSVALRGAMTVRVVRQRRRPPPPPPPPPLEPEPVKP